MMKPADDVKYSDGEDDISGQFVFVALLQYCSVALLQYCSNDCYWDWVSVSTRQSWLTGWGPTATDSLPGRQWSPDKWSPDNTPPVLTFQYWSQWGASVTCLIGECRPMDQSLDEDDSVEAFWGMFEVVVVCGCSCVGCYLWLPALCW